MKFSFLIHPLTNETKDLMRLDAIGIVGTTGATTSCNSASICIGRPRL